MPTKRVSCSISFDNCNTLWMSDSGLLQEITKRREVDKNVSIWQWFEVSGYNLIWDCSGEQHTLRLHPHLWIFSLLRDLNICQDRRYAILDSGLPIGSTGTVTLLFYSKSCP